MELSDLQLREFRDRCLRAATCGNSIAHAERYRDALLSEASSEETGTDAWTLFSLAEAVLKVRAGGSPVRAKAKYVAPTITKMKVEPEVKEPEVKEPEVKQETVSDDPPPPAEETSSDDEGDKTEAEAKPGKKAKKR